MSILIMKFGGVSLSNISKILKIAEIVIQRKKQFSKVVVITSAMGQTTNHLLKLSKKVCANPDKREQDMLISVGERVSMSLLAMALLSKGEKAISFTGSQSGIITSKEHSDAKIVDVRPKRLLSHLKDKIVIVAGFQGVSLKSEITTLGRGGSDTSAVALAVALGAHKVEFYKDVKGIYSADPKKDAKAVLFKKMNYDEALKCLKGGGRILHSRAVELAKKNQMLLHVLPYVNYERERGTLIGLIGKRPKQSPIFEQMQAYG